LFISNGIKGDFSETTNFLSLSKATTGKKNNNNLKKTERPFDQKGEGFIDEHYGP